MKPIEAASREVKRLLGVGWQPEAEKNGKPANGEAT
nr:MAG TPA: hypothetical protein [Caudoviricetes sp.]